MIHLKHFSKFVVVFIFLVIFVSAGFSQNKYTVSGTIKDAATGETMIGATVYLKQSNTVGTISNAYGFYSLTLAQGDYAIICSMIGYEADTFSISLNENFLQDIELKEKENVLNEVVVSSVKENENVTQAISSVQKLNMKEISIIPVLFGEKDILKTIQLLPGIKSAGEGNSGFNVRGGSSDQNLILLDEAQVYNASHLMGFFSTFNGDAIKDITVYKGNSPAQYGGRLASVLDIKMDEGNNKEYHVGGGIGLISSRLSVEGPIQKDKSSFLITGRRTYADMFLKLTDDYNDKKLYFYDLNLKANYRINDKNRIYLSGYFGRDNLELAEQIGIEWGNKTATLRWNCIVNPKLFSNTSLIYSDYNFNIKVSGGASVFHLNSEIEDWNLKQEFQYFTENNNSWKFGFNTIQHNISPSRFSGEGTNENETRNTRKALENAVYLNNTLNLGGFLNIDYGIRFSTYTLIGSGTYNIYVNGVKTDTIVLNNNEFGKTYFNFEPRFSASFVLNENNSIKLSYNRNTQNLHLLSNSTSTSPTDSWIGNSYNIKPETSDQFALGYFLNLFDNAFEFNTEIYYKNMQNQIDYKNGADIEFAADVESELLFGIGRAYGIEMLLKKKSGNFTGWVSYTLSRTERKIDGINQNQWYAAKQNRTHDISVVGTYQFAKNWTASAAWVFYTGNAVTFPSGKYKLEDNVVFLYTERNDYQMPNYHRFDFSFTYEKVKSGRYQSSWNFGIYNAYGRENAYSINFQQDPDNSNRTQAIQTSLFRWIPSITYNFKF